MSPSWITDEDKIELADRYRELVIKDATMTKDTMDWRVVYPGQLRYWTSPNFQYLFNSLWLIIGVTEKHVVSHITKHDGDTELRRHTRKFVTYSTMPTKEG